MKKQKIVVLFGGRSAEREVSMNTGKQVIANLDHAKYRVTPLEIPKTGNRWIAQLLASKPDIAFLALHGPFGEDGTIQGMLEMLEIPYTCSGVLASALAMDKYRLCEFVRSHGIMVPKGILVRKKGSAAVYLPPSGGPNAPEQSSVRGRQGAALQDIVRQIGFPCVVKPNQLGSSIGVTVDIRTEDALRKALVLGLSHDTEVLIEEFIRGREITAPVIGNTHPKALPLIEIIPKSGAFYDYKSKYANGGSDHIIPARISGAMTKKIQAIAVQAHKLLGARGVTRCDFMLKGTTPYFLEINTIPGMTKTSLVPQSAQKTGILFPKLLDRLIELALAK